MPVGGLTLRPGGDNWSWLARCSVPLPPGTSEWLGLVSHSQRRNTLACWLFTKCVCVRACTCDTCVCVCVCITRSVTSLHHALMGPSPSALKRREKDVMVLIGAFPPSTSLSHINIHSIDLFSELTKNKLFARELILTGAWHCCVLFEDSRQQKYAYADTQSKTPIKCWLSPNYCGTGCTRDNKKRSLLFFFLPDMKNECS